MRVKYALGLLLASVVILYTGCGAKESIEENVTTPDVTNEQVLQDETIITEEETKVEEENISSPFLNDLEKYDSIISKLTNEQYYAFAGIGEDYDVLLVADGVFDNGDGNMAAIDAKVYGIDNGQIYEAGSVWSDGTAYPLAVYDNSIMFGGNHHMKMACVRNAAVIIEREAFEEFDEQGNVTYSYDDGNIDDIKTVDDDGILSEMYEKYANATVINFFQGELEIVGDRELEDYPANNFEIRVGKMAFESYDEIIGLLEAGEAYSFVNIKGYEDKVLLVAEKTFEDPSGNIIAYACTPYTRKSTGKFTADSLLASNEESRPLSIDEDGVIFLSTPMSIEKLCYGENGTENRGIMVLAYVYVNEYDSDGNPKTVGGFTRNKNSVIEDDSVSLDENAIETYKHLLDEYEKTSSIYFTAVEP